MSWDWDHTILRAWFGGWLGRKGQVSLDHVFELVLGLLHGLVDDYPIHGASEVKIHFLKDCSGINSLALVSIFAALHFLF